MTRNYARNRLINEYKDHISLAKGRNAYCTGKSNPFNCLFSSAGGNRLMV